MSSTFTTSNRFEMQGTGDNPTTWGARLNDRTVQMIDESIDGVTSLDITVTTSYTLSTASGTTDQSRKRTLVISGAATANATVTVPALNKFYVVDCTYTGNYTVTIKTAGDPGIALKAGDGAVLYVTPSGVFEVIRKSDMLLASNNLSDLTNTATARANLGLGNPTINTFVNDGSTTVRTLSQNPGTINSILVIFDGVVQTPTTDYTLAGTTLTYVTAPANGTKEIIFIGNQSLPAGETSDGSVTIAKLASSVYATNGEATDGTDNTKVMTPLRVKESILANTPANPITSHFESAPQTFTEATLLTVAHGLGAVPKYFDAYLVCQTAEGGYTVGQRLNIKSVYHQGVLSSGAFQLGIATYADATNLYFVYYSAVSSLDNILPSATTGQPYAANLANWKVILTAIK